MDDIKSILESIIVDCFPSPKHPLSDERDAHFIISISLDKDRHDYPINISIPIQTLEHYRDASEDSISKYNERLARDINNHRANYEGGKVTWTINLHVPQ